LGLDEARVSRVPLISVALLVVNVLVYLGTSFAGGDDVVEERFRAVLEYWVERPWLELPEEMDDRFGVTRESLGLMAERELPEVGGTDEERSHLASLCQELIAASDAQPQRRFALVPRRGLAQPGWLTYQFLHGGFFHLLGNMLVFLLVVGPFLEDVWGRPFFLAFYLAGGVVAGVAQVLPEPGSPIGIVGASGAISACIGAFALRFAHRRVRMGYWFAIFLRGTFFVPAWVYAFLGLAMDLYGLKLAGAGGGVAYGAHVGGFFFGIGTAIVVRASGLERRIAPEGAARWGSSLAASRAEDAIAGGDLHRAREHLGQALRSQPGDLDAVLSLARLEADRLNREATTPLVERLLAARLTAGDTDGARALLRELVAAVDPAGLRPATAYRAAGIAEGFDPALAARLDDAAAAAGGGIGAKALLRLAERGRARDPARALDHLERALALEGVPHDVRARAEALARELRPAPAASPALASAPVRVVHCSLVGASAAGLHLETDAGRRALLAPGRVEALAAGLLARHVDRSGPRQNTVLLDLLLAPQPGEDSRIVLRVPGHSMALAAIHPGVAPREAFGRLVDAMVEAGARAAPSREVAAGRPFGTFADADAFELAAWGRRLGAGAATP
jgi:membrane associated rhomboid family serine protease